MGKLAYTDTNVDKRDYTGMMREGRTEGRVITIGGTDGRTGGATEWKICMHDSDGDERDCTEAKRGGSTKGREKHYQAGGNLKRNNGSNKKDKETNENE